MITVRDFTDEHVAAAQRIALDCYNAERAVVSALPDMDGVGDLKHFADNGLGVAAFEGDSMVGFLCCFKPWDGAFYSNARGTISPVHANGAVARNRGRIYRLLYQAAADKWVKNGITYHGISVYAHDDEAKNALFTYGFGLRCVDAIRPMEPIDAPNCPGITYCELEQSDVARIAGLRRMLWDHLSDSPCFLRSSEQNFRNWLARAQARNSRVFVAQTPEQTVAFVEIADGEGENFATEAADMRNICGAFCLPQFRGRGIFQGLLNSAISALAKEGYKRLGVDYESINPTADAFWTKYFTVYTNSAVRRIDDCVLDKPRS